MIISDDLNTTFLYDEEYSIFRKHIQRLIKPTPHSIIFPNAFCQNPLCIPSRASLLTGLHSFSNGIYENENIWDTKPNTIPELLKNEGYFTIGFGKIFHNETQKKEVWDIYEEGNYPEIKLAKNKIGVSNLFDWGEVSLKENEFGDYHTIEKSLEVIKDCPRPFFLAIGLRLPHMPLFVPKGLKETLGISKLPLPLTIENDTDDISPYALNMLRRNDIINIHEEIKRLNLWEEIVLYYFLSLSILNNMIDKLIKAIENMRLLNTTHLLFISDNGWHLGEKKHWRKWTLWKESTNVPLAIHHPEIKESKTINTPVGLIDIFPTIIEICNCAPLPNLEGKSLLPIINKPGSDERVVISQIGKKNFSFRTSEWTYIVYENGDEELYNRKTDPKEWTNIIARMGKKHEVESLEEEDDIDKIRRHILKNIDKNLKEKIYPLLPISTADLLK
ncbi:MAG: sulfatase-like hydrolase/transferase [Candidatus Hydrogenedentes bacterium]|nr:sulfatase-like hydrolase/transferase [Candidatus Hydrogenedentota bacterium]